MIVRLLSHQGLECVRILPLQLTKGISHIVQLSCTVLGSCLNCLCSAETSSADLLAEIGFERLAARAEKASLVALACSFTYSLELGTRSYLDRGREWNLANSKPRIRILSLL
jgi:hypothetical protein